MRSLDAVVFDFDGVIADTEPLHLRAFQELLSARGVALTPAAYYQRYVGLDDWGLAETLARDFPALESSAMDLRTLVERKWERYEEMIETSAVLFDGAEALIRNWCGQVPLAIASGARAHEIETILGRENLLACFRAIATVADVPSGKPAPDIYLLALERLRSSRARDRIDAARVVAIEDSAWGLQAATAAGMRTVAVVGEAARAATMARPEADLVVSSISDLDLVALEGLVG